MKKSYFILYYLIIFLCLLSLPLFSQDTNIPGNENRIVVNENEMNSGVVPTTEPTPQAKQEDIMKSGISVEAKEKSQETIEKEVGDLFKEGKKYYDLEDYAGAIEIWERTIQNYPTSKQLYNIKYFLANAYQYNGNYDKAIITFQKVLAEKPKGEVSDEAYYRLANCYSNLQKWNYAIEIYKDIIRKNQDSKNAIRAYTSMAIIYIRTRNFKRAENIFRNIVKYFPNSQDEINARFQLASILAQTNRFKSAVKEYTLIEYKFANTEWAPRAAIDIGDTYKLAGDIAEAKEAYSRVMFQYYSKENYVHEAEEKINSLKNLEEINRKVYEEEQ